MPILTAPIQIEYGSVIAFAEHPDDRDPTRRESASIHIYWAPAHVRGATPQPSTLNPDLPFRAFGAHIDVDRASGEVRVTGSGATLPGAVEEAVYWTYAPVAQRLATWARGRLAGIPAARYVGFHWRADALGTETSLGFVGGGEVRLRGGEISYHEYSNSRGNPVVEAAVPELAGLERDLARFFPDEITPRR